MQNYKVFINNSLIFFGRKEEDLANNIRWSDFQNIESNSLRDVVNNIEAFQEIDNYYIETDEADFVFEQFLSYFKVLQAAGGLVLNNKDEILMIHRFEHWDFPKGHVEKGEVIEDCAIREVMEETGIEDVEITKSIPHVYHIYNYRDQWILKETHWFIMYSGYNGILKPQLEESIVAAKWVPLNYLTEYMNQSYPGLQQLVKEIGLLR